MNKVSANDIKTKGVGILENETLITVRGEDKFIVLDIEAYNYLRECELEKAIADSIKDMDNNKYHSSVDEHIRRVTDGI